MDFKSMFLVNMVNKLRLLFIAFTSTIAWLVLARGCSGDLHYDRPRNLGWRTKWSYVNELGWCKLLHGYFLVPQVVMHLQVIETSSLLSIILFIISSIETFSVDNSIFQNWKLRTDCWNQKSWNRRSRPGPRLGNLKRLHRSCST